MPTKMGEPFGTQSFNTMNPSKKDVLGPLGFFLGQPMQPNKLDNYTEANAATLHFPDAYMGQNVKLRDTLNNLVLNSPQNWQTTVALPFMQLDGVTVEWDEVRFDVRMMQRVPYEGASRLATATREHHRDRVVRRGLAIIIEHDFYRTPAGRKYFADQIQSIAYCTQETCNFEVLWAYLTCDAYDFRYDGRKRLLDRRAIRNSCRHEITLFAALQKEGRGFDKAIEEGKSRMKRYNNRATPNMLVIAPETALYVSTTATDRLKFIEGGERAVTDFREGVEGFEAKSFRGLGILESNPFDAGENVDAMQPLNRHTQVGEWYEMCAPMVGAAGKADPDAMSIQIFDEVRDRLVTITFADVRKHLHMHRVFANYEAEGGKKADDADPLGIIGWMTATQATNPDAASSLNKSWRARQRCDFTKFSYIDPADWNKLYVMIEEGKWTPFRVILTRPFIEHTMLSMVMAVSGRDTGAMLYGPSDMQISANTQVKTIEGHYTGHFKATITKPQNVLVLRDVQCTGYVAGCDTTFFGSGNTDENPLMSVQNDLEDRVNFNDEDRNQYKSMFALAAPHPDINTDWVPDVAFSMSDMVVPWDATRVRDQNAWCSFPGGNYMREMYDKSYGLSKYIHQGSDPGDVQNHAFVRSGTFCNSFCFPGPYRSKGLDNKWQLNPGQGHFGADAVSGDARWRRGEGIDVTTARAQAGGC